MYRLSTSHSKSMAPMLSSSSLLFHSLLYLPVALSELEISTAVLHSLLSFNWNCTLVFFFKVDGFGSSGSLYEALNFSNDALVISFKVIFRDCVNVLLNGFFLIFDS